MKVVTVLAMLFVSTILNFQPCGSYRILGVFPFPVKSHFIMFEALMKGLARKGHRVDVISMFPLKAPCPNYTDIIKLPLASPPLLNNLTYDDFISRSADPIHCLAETLGNSVCEFLGHSGMRELIRNPPNDPPYDISIAEFYTTNCFLAMGHLLKVPMIGVSSTPLYPWLNSAIGNPQNLAFVPNNMLGYGVPMNFWKRVWNTVYSIYCDLYFHHIARDQDTTIRKHVSGFVPEVREMVRNLGLVLVNSHVSLNGGRPMTSTIVEVGGLHIPSNDAKLPKDLEKWMNSSEDGFVYFTFGSMVTIESFPEKFLQILYKSLSKIAPVRVLMKIVDPKKLPPELPKNIRTFRWAPQLRVLEHKNAKAFITHGGLMGTQEAIYCAVPMIGIPLFIDQFVNVDLYVQKKIAIKLTQETLTEESLDDALNDVLYNPIYKTSAAKLSKQFWDRPMNALDTATWWIEYIARNGNEILRSPGLDQAWWQIELLDVYLFLLLVTAGLTLLAIVLARFVVKIYLTMISPAIKSTEKFD